MSNDILTPMNGVLGMLTARASSPLVGRQHHHANATTRSRETLLPIISGILGVAKFESGRFLLAEDEFELREAIDQAVNLFAEPARRKSLELMCWIGTGVPSRAVGDKDRLQQVLAILLGNALKFTEKGQVVVRAERIEDSQGDLRFEVEDTGVGVPRDRQQSLFDAFRQADDSVTPQYGSTGWGLAIAKYLVEAMGGAIGMDGEQQVGATFWFTLRLGESGRREDIQAGEPSNFAGARALIVCANPISLDILRRQLTGWQIECHTVADAYEALRCVDESVSGANHPYDVLLSDAQMDGMGGYELARRLEAGQLVGVPPILLLGDGTPYHLPSQSEPKLIVEYLAKPVSESDLRASLATILDMPGRSGKLARTSERNAALWRPIDGTAESAADTKFDPRPMEQLRSLRRASRPDVVGRVIEAYFGSCPDLLQRIHAAMSRGDNDEIREAAHALKSSSLNVGAVGLASLCADLEQKACAKASTNAEHLIPRIEFAFAAASETLNAIKAESS